MGIVIYIIGFIILLMLIIMLLKKVFHLRVDDNEYSDKDDYLERRINKDDKED